MKARQVEELRFIAQNQKNCLAIDGSKIRSSHADMVDIQCINILRKHHMTQMSSFSGQSEVFTSQQGLKVI